MTLRIHNQTHKRNDFIRGWYLDNDPLCDNLIEYFEAAKDKGPGTQGPNTVDKKIKDSTDCVLHDSDVAFEYFANLQKVVDEYVQIYPYVNQYNEWRVVEGTNIQRYFSNQAYYGWHTERASAEHPKSARHMVFMTYLNNVEQGGETEYYHQQIKIKPEKGLTLLWPADWTFTHRGCPAIYETKYIVTGWFSYTDYKENNNVN